MMPASRNVRWAIMGAGAIARTMAPIIRAADGAELVAIASRDERRAKAFASEFGVRQWYGDYKSLARAQDVDVVYLATPPARHIDDGRLVLENGKHLLCEKPLVAAGQSGDELVALAAERKLFIMEAMWTRFLPAIEKVLELLQQPETGKVQLMIAGGAFKPECDPNYYLFRADLGGGVMNDAGIYLLHLAHWVLGPPQSLAASASIGMHGVDEHDALILDYASGAKAMLYVSMRASQAPHAEILCEHSRISIGAPIFNPNFIEFHPVGGKAQTWRYQPTKDNYRFQIEEVTQCVRNGEIASARMPPDLSLSVSRLLSHAATSAKQMRLVELK